MLMAMGSDISIITEVVHSSSTVMDSRHFAEEFIRRRDRAAKGLIEPTTASPSGGKSGNDWSAVAKKGPVAASPSTAQQEPFKIAKRKGGRK